MSHQKSQHFVPRGYLKAWEFADKKLWLYDLKKEKTHDGDPAKLCAEDHFYTLEELKNEKLIIDDFFKKIEDEGLPAIKKIIIGQKLLPFERTAASWFIAAQRVRTKFQMKQDHDILQELMIKKIIEGLENPEWVKAMLENLAKTNIDKDQLEKVQQNPKDFMLEGIEALRNGDLVMEVKNKKEQWIPTMMESMQAMANIYENSDWFILRAGRKRSFVTSDNPVCTISCIGDVEKATKDDVQGVEVTLPLSPKVAMLIQYKGNGRTIEFSEKETGESVQEINLRTTMYAERYIFSHNRELLETTAKRHHKVWSAMQSHPSAREHVKGLIPIVNLPEGVEPKLTRRDYRVFTKAPTTSV